ncbi:hypothetical protein BDY24DRAFT_406510 [Mrakia frigida]|uniref:uncharacterized protein n=1 Tax=Mrakia frigida TaxID=29902 RepID=UPI003FCC14F3
MSSSLVDAKIDSKSVEAEGLPELPSSSSFKGEENKISRTPIDYSSVKAFRTTLATRLKTTFTRRFIYCLIAGQVISWCITGTNTLTTSLVNNGFNAPTTQSFFTYFALFIVYTPYTIYRYGFKGWGQLLYKDGWKYAFLAACDVEGNFLVVKAYQYTNLLSCMLLNAWAIPSCMFFSWLLMKVKFRWTQIAGIFVCICGLGLLVASDNLTGKDWEASVMWKGDVYMIAGATLYGFTNACEEFLVRKRPLYEVVGQLGMWGVVVNGIQSSALEHNTWFEITWNGPVAGFLVAYTACMFILYTLAPLVYRSSSSVFYNLSILTSNFFGLLIGIALFGYTPYWLYFVAFVVIIVGLIGYFWFTPPEEEAAIDVTRPVYVNQVESESSEHIAGLAIGDLVKSQQQRETAV